MPHAIVALDTEPYSRDELAAIAEELSRLVSALQAGNMDMLAEIGRATLAAEGDREAMLTAVASIVAETLPSWSLTVAATAEAAMARIASRLGHPAFTLN